MKSLLTRARENLRQALAAYVTGSAAGGAPAADDDDRELGAHASRRGPPRRSHDDEPL